VLSRPVAAYRLFQGDGVIKIPEDFVFGTAASVLRAVFSLKNVRRAPGPTGTLRRYVLYTLTIDHATYSFD
jgi:linoleate 10R-lipoxygenase